MNLDSDSRKRVMDSSPDFVNRGELDSNPDLDSDWLDSDLNSDSRKKGWIQIQWRRGGFRFEMPIFTHH